MTLDPKLIRDFAKLLNTNQNGSPDTQYMYGIMDYQGEEPFVRLDGAEVLTPVVETMDAIDGDRVIVMLKNHEAIVIGNITSPASARTATNFMDLTEEGLIIGAIDPATHEPTGYHTRIDNDSFDIVDGNGDSVVSFGEETIFYPKPGRLRNCTITSSGLESESNTASPGIDRAYYAGEMQLLRIDDTFAFKGYLDARIYSDGYGQLYGYHPQIQFMRDRSASVRDEILIRDCGICVEAIDKDDESTIGKVYIDVDSNPQAPSVDLANENGSLSLILNPSGRVTLTSKYGNVSRYFGIFPDNNTFHMSVAGLGDSGFKFRDGGGIEWNHTNSKNSNVNHFVITDDGKFQFNGINLMYYKNDTITLANSAHSYLCSGFLTDGNSSVRITLPFNKILGASIKGVSVVGNITGRVRQNNKYILGNVSNPGTFTSPSVALTTNRDGVNLLLTIPAVSGSINNDAVGIEFNNLQLKFT